MEMKQEDPIGHVDFWFRNNVDWSANDGPGGRYIETSSSSSWVIFPADVILSLH